MATSLDSLPLLKNGEEYLSQSKKTLTGINGAKLLEVEMAPELHIQMAMPINKKAGFSLLQNLSIDEVIDIYVDADIRAGRQNGLLEAASCGKMIVGTKGCGVCDQLIEHDVNGALVQRTINGIISGLKCVTPEHGANIRKTIEEGWSWDKQARLFETVFNDVLKGCESHGR